MKSNFKLTASIATMAIIGFYGGYTIARVIIPFGNTNSLLTAEVAGQPAEKDSVAKVEDQKPAIYFSSLLCPKPKKEYKDYSSIDVGQKVAIPDVSYIPSDLVELGKDIVTTTPVCLKMEAAESLTRMIDTAKKDGSNIKVSSGFRSYATQKAILARNIKEGNKNAKIAIAKPGYSEHQLGVAVDLTSPSIANESAAKRFQETKEDDWLESHSYEYGFIESYPEDKLDVTGYMYEAWHYRYVGIDAALEIHTNGQTVNQYLKEKNK